MNLYSFHCSAVKIVKLPKNLRTIPDSCFYDCNKLRTVMFPLSFTVETNSFFGCNKLCGVIAPDNVKQDLINIGKMKEQSFIPCPSLPFTSMKKSIKSFRYISDDDSLGLRRVY